MYQQYTNFQRDEDKEPSFEESAITKQISQQKKKRYNRTQLSIGTRWKTSNNNSQKPNDAGQNWKSQIFQSTWLKLYIKDTNTGLEETCHVRINLIWKKWTNIGSNLNKSENDTDFPDFSTDQLVSEIITTLIDKLLQNKVMEKKIWINREQLSKRNKTRLLNKGQKLMRNESDQRKM